VLFLIEYDRSRGQLLTFKSFPEGSRSEASEARLELELSLSRRGVEREVVLLEARTEQDLRRTHRRYFEGLKELAERVDRTSPQRVAEGSTRSRTGNGQ
jgi:hypothetical protein